MGGEVKKMGAVYHKWELLCVSLDSAWSGVTDNTWVIHNRDEIDESWFVARQCWGTNKNQWRKQGYLTPPLTHHVTPHMTFSHEPGPFLKLSFKLRFFWLTVYSFVPYVFSDMFLCMFFQYVFSVCFFFVCFFPYVFFSVCFFSVCFFFLCFFFLYVFLICFFFVCFLFHMFSFLYVFFCMFFFL